MEPERQKPLLFAYGSFLEGEKDHPALVGCKCLGPARTRAGFRLVDLGPFPAMIVSGDGEVEGELYAINREVLMKLDRIKEIGRLFHRRTVELDSGLQAEVYLMNEDQVRGRRRLRVSDWRQRFSAHASLRPPPVR